MRGRTLGILVVLGVIALGGGWYFGTATTPNEQSSLTPGTLMFPDLAGKLTNAAKVEIVHQGKQTVIEKRPDGGWGIASMHDYPVQETKLRGLLTGLTELRLMEARTTDPSEFGRLGLDDPNAAGSSAHLMRVLDGTGKPIIAAIIGHRVVRNRANVPEQVYVRKPDDNQTWLAEGSVQADPDAAQWLDRSVMNIAASRIGSVEVGDGLRFGLADGRFALIQPADHPKLEDYKVDDVGRALEQLTFQEVKTDADLKATEAGHAAFTTKDGLAVTATVFHADKDVWARFSAAASSDAAKPEADALNARLAGWSYQIGAWKEKSLVPTLDDLKAEETTAPAGVTPGGPPASSPMPGTPAAGSEAPGSAAPGSAALGNAGTGQAPGSTESNQPPLSGDGGHMPGNTGGGKAANAGNAQVPPSSADLPAATDPANRPASANSAGASAPARPGSNNEGMAAGAGQKPDNQATEPQRPSGSTDMIKP